MYFFTKIKLEKYKTKQNKKDVYLLCELIYVIDYFNS